MSLLLLAWVSALRASARAAYAHANNNRPLVQHLAKHKTIKACIATAPNLQKQENYKQNGPGPAYDHKQVENKWQQFWQQNKVFKANRRKGKPKKYVLDMFPYPSGAGLHVGHPEGYTASDIMARYWRMCDFDVLHPMGWDSFGLPAEQHAINTGTHPRETTAKNIANFKRQLQSLGFSFDWDRELATTDEEYVKWTQWIFLKLYEKGLAFQDQMLVNWCSELGTVLANEEVIDGLSERGGFPVMRRPLRQWVLKITALADELESDLEGLEWPEGTMAMQKAWIGRSEGAEISFAPSTDKSDGWPANVPMDPVKVFTTRPDTVIGVSYVVVAPEHPLAAALAEHGPHAESVSTYIATAASKSDLERTVNKEKSGVDTGVELVHPLTGETVPLWVADYVLAGYGTGAVMAVPAHDERDFDFAKTFDLPIKRVVAKKSEFKKGVAEGKDMPQLESAMVEKGVAVNCGQGLDGLSSEAVSKEILNRLRSSGDGDSKVTYKLRDWNFSRQRYWGEPIPIYFPVTVPKGVDPRSGADVTIHYDEPHPVAESELPIKLPELDDFSPGDDPQGCLARCLDWRFFQRDGRWWARETNTMPQWAGSCWYYLRFADPLNTRKAWSEEAENSWLPVDLYVGGSEHAVLHLLYARFWHKVLYSQGLVSTKEPFKRLVHQGMILGEDGEKMSKSRGNVVNPDDIVRDYGADAMRLYEMFMGPLEAVKPWQTEQISGVVRFQSRVYSLAQRADESAPFEEDTARAMNKAIKKVSESFDALSFNTAISALMVYSNHLQTLKNVPSDAVRKLVLLLSAIAPHLGEEAWQMLGGEHSISKEAWPTFDAAMCEETDVTMGVQVNGKVRGQVTLPKDADEETARARALEVSSVAKNLQGKQVIKLIYKAGRVINFVAK